MVVSLNGEKEGSGNDNVVSIVNANKFIDGRLNPSFLFSAHRIQTTV